METLLELKNQIAEQLATFVDLLAANPAQAVSVGAAFVLIGLWTLTRGTKNTRDQKAMDAALWKSKERK